MKLYIAEKPSLARAIADAFPKPHKKVDGCIYLANGDVVSWCIGHLLVQVDPDAYDPRYKKWKIEDLPIIPTKWQLKPAPKTSKQLTILKKLIRDASELIHVGDPDREGQLLVDQVINATRITKAKLHQVQRCLISDLTANAVKRSLAQLRSNQEFVPLSTSALARSRADWLYGFNLTRLYSIKAQKFGYKGVLSVGRVQTPLLGLVVRRDKEIIDFISKPFFEVNAHINGLSTEKIIAKWKPSEACESYQDQEGRVLVKDLAQNVATRITNKSATVSKYENKEKKQLAPLLYNLSALQIDAAKRFGYTAMEVLNICQNLYERLRLITYPRSDSRYLPSNHFLQAKGVTDAIKANSPSLSKFVVKADLSLKNRVWNDQKVDAHHAIIPTDKKHLIAQLDKSSQDIYNLIATQYLAQFYPDHKYNESKIEFIIEQGVFQTSAKSKSVIGWKDLFNENQKDQFLPKLKIGDVLHCERGVVVEKNTTPPAYFNDATLLGAMSSIFKYVKDPELKKILKETDGLGTEATRAGIIELLFKRGFLSRSGKTIISTETGQKLIEVLPEILTYPDLTAQWEMELNDIVTRKQSYNGFILPLEEKLNLLIKDGINDQSNAFANLPPCENIFTKKRKYKKLVTKRVYKKKK